jgi:uroporphyrinogen-III synthase
MNLPLLILRPEPGNSATCAQAAALGIEAVAAPLFTIAPVAWDPPPPDGIDALLIGSANALRHAGPALTTYADKPAYVVGEATAQAARAAGLRVVAVGTGGLQGVLDDALDRVTHRRLLRLAGQERLTLTLPPGVTMVERVVYAAMPLPLPSGAARLMLAHALPGVAVALHSAAAASHLASEMVRLDLPRHRLHLVALGPRIAAAAGAGWAAIHTAPAPDERSLLALAAQVCHTPAPRGRG